MAAAPTLPTPTSDTEDPALTKIRDLVPDQVAPALGSSPLGLTTDEATERLRIQGPNRLPQPRRRPLIRRFAAQFGDLFALMLLTAAGTTTVAYLLSRPHDVGNLQLTIAILAVVLLNAVIGFGQEYAAERTAEALRAMVPHRTRVIRDGVGIEIPAEELVVGDVIVLEAGDAVSADCRVVEAHDLAVNNVALTGESEPARRTADPVRAGTPRLEARNCVWMGTTVASGTGKAVVAATGARTEFGRIFRLTAETVADRSPLQRQVATMARRVATAAFFLGALVFAVRVPEGGSIVATFVFALGVMVALVPEGLPATLSVALAIGVRRMARRRALIKKLLAVETLGSTTVICTDKTGTLTKAEMTVQSIWATDGWHQVSGVGYAPEGEVERPETVRDLLRVAALCCDARLVPPQADTPGWQILGDTTEGAILVAAAKAGLDLHTEQAAAPRVGEFPFDADRKLMTTLHTVDGITLAYVKGAPSELLARCTSFNGHPLDEETRERVLAAGDSMASAALRVLAIACRTVDNAAAAGQQDVENGLALLGLVGMLDPPRPEVVAATAACHRAGIRIVMVTGDYALTAEAIARKVGVISGPKPHVVTGAELDGLTDADLRALVGEPGDLLFARVRPEHKMRVVAAFKARGEVVAVTGDGANDAPALKRSDIGIAMGASGTDVAREASVMILLDDSFASIAAAVELGYMELDRRCAELLFQVLTEREEKNSVAIASNDSFGGWTKTFTDPRLCAAIVDRLTCNGVIVETGTDSYRLAQTRARAEHEAG